MNELLKCPFCGSEGKLRYDDLDHHYIVQCSSCDACMQYGYKSKELAIRLWNTRHQELKPLELNELSLMADEIRLGPKDEVTFKISQGTRLALNSRLQQFIENVCFRFGVKGD